MSSSARCHGDLDAKTASVNGALGVAQGSFSLPCWAAVTTRKITAVGKLQTIKCGRRHGGGAPDLGHFFPGCLRALAPLVRGVEQLHPHPHCILPARDTFCWLPKRQEGSVGSSKYRQEHWGDHRGKCPFLFYLGFPSQSISFPFPFQAAFEDMAERPGLGGGPRFKGISLLSTPLHPAASAPLRSRMERSKSTRVHPDQLISSDLTWPGALALKYSGSQQGES